MKKIKNKKEDTYYFDERDYFVKVNFDRLKENEVGKI